MSSPSFTETAVKAASGEPENRRRSQAGRVLRWLLEVAAITAVFAAAGSWPVPDSNEAYYLTKARHAADPAWCAEDFFLASRDAHVVFFRLMGPLAAARPLDEAAWIGRWLGWLLLAVGMRQAAATVLDREPGAWSWISSCWHVAAACLFSVLVRFTPASGEWVIGGCESKVFAWGFVLVAAAAVAAGRFGAAWLAAGLAAAVHPIVGGWAFLEVGCVATWQLLRGLVAWGRGSQAGSTAHDGPQATSGGRRVAAAFLGLAAGAAIAAVGVVPAAMLSQGVDLSIVAEAARIQVVERLPHHLLPERFQATHVVAHLLTAAVAVLAWAAARPSRPLDRLTGLAMASLGVSAAGVAIALARPFAEQVADQLLRFYWFRSADGLVPLAATLAITDWLRWQPLAGQSTSPQRLPAVLAAVTLALVVIGLDVDQQRRHWPLAENPPANRADRHVDAASWRAACDWIRDNTPTDAVFLTPRGAATFTWWSERAEVVGWKNMPQDPTSVVAWRQRIFDLFSPDGNTSLSGLERSTAALGEPRVRELAAQYAATHIVVPQSLIEDAGEPLPGCERLHANDGYVVYVIESDRDVNGFDGTVPEIDAPAPSAFGRPAAE